MSLEQAIHQRWSTSRILCDLVPPERVFTGLAPPATALPYATLERSGLVESARTSSGTRIELVELRWSVWDNDLDRAKNVADAIVTHFDRAGFPWSDGDVLDCKLAGRTEIQSDDGVWRVTLDFRIRTSQQGNNPHE